MEETRLRCENAHLQEKLSRIEALEWLIEVQEYILANYMSLVLFVGFQDWQRNRSRSVSCVYNEALHDAGYGG